jgi:acetylornithine deacetylase/succinyl-diaminopimelate desuccinylase-like protein
MLVRAVSRSQAGLVPLKDQLRDLVRIPSISADSAHAADVRRCADWLVQRLHAAGFRGARLLRTTGHPVIYARWRERSDLPSLLVYGHYDVQPPGELTNWSTQPFEPVLDGEYLIGRGAADDKGPLLALIFALESCLALPGPLPLNVTCVLEGEEEIGSPSLAELIQQQPELFAADAALVADTRSPGPRRPSITYALRGLLSVEVVVRAATHDVHAGHFGGAVQGASEALAELIARLHDHQGRVTVPGFYDSVRRVSPARRAELARIGRSDDNMLAEAGAIAAWGEQGFSMFERTTLRPALTTTAFGSGHVDRGSYVAALPAEARARIDIRLVADQEPDDVLRQLDQFLTDQSTRMGISVHSMACVAPVVFDRRTPAMQAAVAACERGFRARPEFHRSGATIPAVSWLHQLTGMPVVLLGLSTSDDRRHGPNERVHLPTLQRGITTAGAFLSEFERRARR